MVYSYYDFLENYYESYFDSYLSGSNTTYNGTYPPSVYQYDAPYNMQYITTSLFSISIVCGILSEIIAILTLCKIYKWKNKNRTIIGLTIFCMVTHLIQNIMDPITYYAWYINYAPTMPIAMNLFMTWDISWVIAKLSLYILFMYRYWLIVEASATSRMEKYIVLGSFMTAMLVQCALYVVYLLYGYVIAHDSKKAQRAYLNVCWAFLAMDTLLICVLVYLLCRSVLKLVISIHTLDPIQRITSLRMHSLSFKNTFMRSNSKLTTTHRSPLAVTPSIHSNASVPVPRKMISNTISNTMTETTVVTPGSMDVPTIGTPSDYQVVPYESGYIDRSQAMDHDGSTCLGVPHGLQSQPNGFSDVPLSENVRVVPNDERKQSLTVRAVSTSVTSREDRTVTGMKPSDGKLTRKRSTSRQERRLHRLLHTATRIAVTMMISMLSSFVHQSVWLLTMELEHDNVRWVSYTWCMDGVINMLCVYLS
eukprot:315136_1